VKFLFDENLSHRLLDLLAKDYPDSVHVRNVELTSANDADVWRFAKEKSLTIVSKDSDFHQRSFLFGAPPKVIWIRKGNCRTSDIADILRQHKSDIDQFEIDANATFLELD